jgi:hypothetical protein
MRGISAIIATNPVMPVQAGLVALRAATTGRRGMLVSSRKTERLLPDIFLAIFFSRQAPFFAVASLGLFGNILPCIDLYN